MFGAVKINGEQGVVEHVCVRRRWCVRGGIWKDFGERRNF